MLSLKSLTNVTLMWKRLIDSWVFYVFLFFFIFWWWNHHYQFHKGYTSHTVLVTVKKRWITNKARNEFFRHIYITFFLHNPKAAITRWSKAIHVTINTATVWDHSFIANTVYSIYHLFIYLQFFVFSPHPVPLTHTFPLFRNSRSPLSWMKMIFLK